MVYLNVHTINKENTATISTDPGNFSAALCFDRDQRSILCNIILYYWSPKKVNYTLDDSTLIEPI